MVFASITTVTLGGGYVIVPVMGHAIVKRGWMTEDHYYDTFAKAQAYPGPMALSTALLVSIELCGFRGAIAALAGVILPPFLVIVLVSKLLMTYGTLPAIQRFLNGAGAVVPGIVAAMVWKNTKRRAWNAQRIVELAILTALLILFPAASLPILLGGIVIMYLLEGVWKR